MIISYHAPQLILSEKSYGALWHGNYGRTKYPNVTQLSWFNTISIDISPNNNFLQCELSLRNMPVVKNSHDLNITSGNFGKPLIRANWVLLLHYLFVIKLASKNWSKTPMGLNEVKATPSISLSPISAKLFILNKLLFGS